MKKIVSLMLVFAMLLSVFSIFASASDEKLVSYAVNVEADTDAESQVKEFAGDAKTIITYYDKDNKLLNASESYVSVPDAKLIKVFKWEGEKTETPAVQEVPNNTPAKKPGNKITILTIGNSFADDATAYLDEIAAENGVTIEIHSANIGGSRIAHHWTAMNPQADEETRKAYKDSKGNAVTIDYFLDNNTYDYITFQQNSSHGGKYESYIDDGADDMLKYLREKQPTTEIILHLTWAYEKNSDNVSFGLYLDDQERMHNEITKAGTDYCAHAASLVTGSGLPVSLDGKPLRYIPAGIAFQIARKNSMFNTESDPNDRTAITTSGNKFIDETKQVSLHRDSYHASFTWGRYLVALTWYGSLTGNSVLDVEYVPYSSGKISERQRYLLNKAAEEAVDSVGIWR